MTYASARVAVQAVKDTQALIRGAISGSLADNSGHTLRTAAGALDVSDFAFDTSSTANVTSPSARLLLEHGAGFSTPATGRLHFMRSPHSWAAAQSRLETAQNQGRRLSDMPSSEVAAPGTDLLKLVGTMNNEIAYALCTLSAEGHSRIRVSVPSSSSKTETEVYADLRSGSLHGCKNMADFFNDFGFQATLLIDDVIDQDGKSATR